MKRPLSFLALLSTLAAVAAAQLPYRITTVAGSGPLRFSGDGGSLVARLVQPTWVEESPFGDVFLSETYFNTVLHVDAGGSIYVTAGRGETGFSGDLGPAFEARINTPGGVATDGNGSVYFADQNNNRVRYVIGDGRIRTLTGTGVAGYGGDGGPVRFGVLDHPAGLAIDRTRNLLYVSEPNGNRVRRVDLAPGGMITLLAGTGVAGFSGDGGQAAAAQLNSPQGLAVAADGSVLIVDQGNRRVRRVGLNGVIQTIAGTGQAGTAGDGGQATAAQFVAPVDIAVNADGSIVVTDPEGALRTINGAGAIQSIQAPELTGAFSVTPSQNGGFLVTAGVRVYRVRNGVVTPFAGGDDSNGIGEEGPAGNARILEPYGVAILDDGTIYLGDAKDRHIRRVDPNGFITTVMRGSGRAMAVDSLKRVYVTTGTTVVRLNPGLGPTLIAGGGAEGEEGGDGFPADLARLGDVRGLAFDTGDNLFIADAEKHVIRRVDMISSVISTIAGTGTPGFSGDGGPAAAAQLRAPESLSVGPDGTLYIADRDNNRIRAIREGVIETFAGDGSATDTGDGGPAISAGILAPTGVLADSKGFVFVAAKHRVRRIRPDGTIETIAGNSQPGFSGDGAGSTAAQLSSATALGMNSRGEIVVSDQGNYRVRKLEPVHFFAEGVVNAANYTAPIAPGMIISIFGIDLGPDPAVTGGLNELGFVETNVGGVEVRFDGFSAPIFYAGPGQLNVQAPYEIENQPMTTILALRNGVPLNSAIVPVAHAAPGIFAIANGTGQIIAFNQDNSLNSAANPERPGRVVVCVFTGGGVNNPRIPTGALSVDPPGKPIREVKVDINGVEAEVLFAGGAGFAGLTQVNFVIPPGTPAGTALPIRIRMAEFSSPAGTTIAVGQ